MTRMRLTALLQVMWNHSENKRKKIIMAENKRTEIAELGEFGLIDHLTKDLKPQNASTK